MNALCSSAQAKPRSGCAASAQIEPGGCQTRQEKCSKTMKIALSRLSIEPVRLVSFWLSRTARQTLKHGDKLCEGYRLRRDLSASHRDLSVRLIANEDTTQVVGRFQRMASFEQRELGSEFHSETHQRADGQALWRYAEGLPLSPQHSPSKGHAGGTPAMCQFLSCASAARCV